VDGVPPPKPVGLASVGPAIGSSGGSFSGPSGGDSIIWKAEGGAEVTATKQKTAADGAVVAKKMKKWVNQT
jgi:hypothetical protein